MAKVDVNSLGSGYSDTEADFYVDAELEAMGALMLTASPDLAALAYKMEVFAAEDCFNLDRDCRTPLFGALIADLQRLSSNVERS